MAGTKPTNDENPKAIGKLAQELGKRKPFDLLEEEVFVSIIRTADVLALDFAHLFSKHDLSGPLYNALRIVGGQQKTSGEGVPVGLISEQLVCRQPDTTRLVDRLESLGYVVREYCPVDARRRLVRITQKGVDVLKALHRPVRDLHRTQFKSLSPKMLSKLGDLLQSIRDGLKADEEE